MTESVSNLDMNSINWTQTILFQRTIHDLNGTQFLSLWMKNQVQFTFAHVLLL